MYTVGLDVDKLLVFTVKILLYAGNFCISSPLVLITLGTIYLFKPFFTEKSAGNFCFSAIDTTVTKNTYNKYTNLPLISDHSKYKSNLSDEEFGYFLAGLIEGSGNFGFKKLDIVLEDASFAYYLKKRIGFGVVIKQNNRFGCVAAQKAGKKAVITTYQCSHQKGLFYILSLINGKFVSKYKYEQLIQHNYTDNFNINILPPLTKLSLDNYWLAGFTQAGGSFYISVVNSKTHETGYSVRLEFSLKHKDHLPLKLLNDLLKMGNLFQNSSGIWCYKSTDFKTAFTLINYFDKYNVFAGKYVDYFKFRKVYRRITKGEHLEISGVKKIISIATKGGSSETSTQEV